MPCGRNESDEPDATVVIGYCPEPKPALMRSLRLDKPFGGLPIEFDYPLQQAIQIRSGFTIRLLQKKLLLLGNVIETESHSNP